MQARLGVVVDSVSVGGRSLSFSGVPEPRLLVRRLGRGLGGTSGRQRSFRPLVSSGCGSLDQRQGASGGGEVSASLCSSVGRLYSCGVCRQFDCGGLSAQAGGNAFSSVELHCAEDPSVGRVSTSC